MLRAGREREVFSELAQPHPLKGLPRREFASLASTLERIGKNLGAAINRDLGLETAPLHKLAEEVLKNVSLPPRPPKGQQKENKEEPFEC